MFDQCGANALGNRPPAEGLRIEVAWIIRGHRSDSVTKIYAELDDEKAKEVMQRIE
jgi:hypothetical protein